MMDEKQLNDSFFDALFGQAVIDNFYEEYNALPPLEELAKEYTFSEKHEKRMKILFIHEERIERYKKFILVSKKIAAVFIILFTMLIGALVFNPEVRAAVTDTITSWYSEFVKFVSPDVEVEGYNMVPTYIPVGFKEDFSDIINDSILILYSNDNGEVIHFEANRATYSVYIDSEDTYYEERIANKITYNMWSTLIEGRGNSIVWDINGWRYFLRSSIDVETLYKIALSLE